MAKTPKMGAYYPQPHYEEEDDEFHEEDEFEEDNFDDEEDNFDEDDGFDEEEEEEEKQESENDKKLPEQKAETKSVTVKLKHSEMNKKNDLTMKIDEDMQLRWLMIHYCEKKGLNRSSIRFMFNGVVVRDTDTPLQLSMVDRDVIYVFRKNSDLVRNEIRYKTLCIRTHKRRDTFVRILFTDPVLPQLKRHFSDGTRVSTCFVYNGYQLTESEDLSASVLGMEDGDIIDAFDFAKSSSSLSIITPAIAPVSRHLTLRVKDRWGGPFDIRVKGNTPLKEAAQKYAGITIGYNQKVDLFYNGRQLSLDKTVEEERLVDGCVLMAKSY